jgi:hypothetical protein
MHPTERAEERESDMACSDFGRSQCAGAIGLQRQLFSAECSKPWLSYRVRDSAAGSAPMFVTNHVLSGVVIGRLLERRPVTAFVVGVGSHLALDMVPHWGCETCSTDGRQLFLRYAKRDGLVGLLAMACVTGAVDRRARVATLAAMAGAAVLDADKPMMHFLGRNPFPMAVRRIHARAQNESLEGMPNEILFGLSCAIADAAIAVNSRRRYSSAS